MSEHITTEPERTELRVSAADVDWIDRHGTARVHGHFFTPYDVITAEFPGDRTGTGELRVLARQRIAAELTRELSARIEKMHRNSLAQSTVIETSICGKGTTQAEPSL